VVEHELVACWTMNRFEIRVPFSFRILKEGNPFEEINQETVVTAARQFARRESKNLGNSQTDRRQ
jgi:hypothetical protein